MEYMNKQMIFNTEEDTDLICFNNTKVEVLAELNTEECSIHPENGEKVFKVRFLENCSPLFPAGYESEVYESELHEQNGGSSVLPEEELHRMKYKVFHKTTKEDITAKFDWVITPDGRLAFNYWGDFIRDPNAIAVPEDEVEDFLR